MDGPPGRTRTCNLRLRRPLHYPVVLRAEGAQYPTPEHQGQVEKGQTGVLGGRSDNAGQHRPHALIQECFRFNRSVKQIDELVGFQGCDAMPH